MTILLETLLANAVTVTVLAVMVFVVSKLIRHQTVIHGLWVLVLLKLLTPSILPLPYSISVDNSLLSRSTQQVFGEFLFRPRVNDSTQSEVHFDSRLSDPDLTSKSNHDSGFAASRAAPLLIADSNPTVWHNLALMPVDQLLVSGLLLIWMSGSGLYVARLLIRYVRFCRFLRRNEKVDEDLISEGYDLAYKMGLKRPPRVRVLSGAFSPMLCGLGRGLTLILPANLLNRLTPEGRATLIVHELAHYARGDYLVRVLETLVTTVYWWHPVVWWVRHELETVEEDCCDSRVLAEFPGEPRHYAEAILDAIDFLCEQPVVMPPIASGLGSAAMLKRRLTRIMTESPMKNSPSWINSGLFASALIVLPIQMIQFRPESESIRAVVTAPELAESTLVIAKKNRESVSESVVDILTEISPKSVWSSVRSPDGRWTLFADQNQVCRIGSADGRHLVVLPTSNTSCVVFSPDSEFLAVGMADGTVAIFRGPDWKLASEFHAESAVRSIDWSSRDRRIAIGTENGQVKLLTTDGRDRAVSRQLSRSPVNCLRFSPLGDSLVIGCGDWKTELDSTLMFVDPKTLRLLKAIDSASPVALIRFGQQSDELMSCDWGGRVTLWSLPKMFVVNSQWIPKDSIAPLAFSSQADDRGLMSRAF